MEKLKTVSLLLLRGDYFSKVRFTFINDAQTRRSYSYHVDHLHSVRNNLGDYLGNIGDNVSIHVRYSVRRSTLEFIHR